MTLSLRRADSSDAAAAGDICYRAFRAIADQHNFPPDFPSPQMATAVLEMLINHPGFFDTVAELNGRIAGSNFLDERDPIGGVGPVTVDPELQNEGVGSALMQAVMERSAAHGSVGVRLVQAAYHRRTLALYLKLGFEVRELLACLQGPAIKKTIPGFAVRPATSNDVPACNRLCFRVHGHERGGELADAIKQGAASVVERNSRITGYATPIAFFGHAVAATNEDLMALIAAAESFQGAGFLVPTRNGELMRWSLAEGLRITQPMTLMTRGLYNPPVGAWLPSVLY